MKAEVRVSTFDAPFDVRESYALLKKRLLDGQDFIEMTDKDGRKVLYNKMSMVSVQAVVKLEGKKHMFKGIKKK